MRRLSFTTRTCFCARCSVLAAILAVNALAQAPAAKNRRAERPNLLVVTFDTTRADHLGPYGFQDIRTPTIDGLATAGTLFEDVQAQSPQTLPNHTSLFTGLYTITHNVRSNGQRLEDRAITLAEVLRTEGYQTGAIVAAAVLMSDFNLSQGFATYNDDFEDPAIYRGFRAFFRLFSRGKINFPSTRPGNRVSALANQWLRKAAGQKQPFFLWVHFYDPHEPYEYRADFKKPYKTGNSGKKNAFGVDEASYINEIEFADFHLGRVLHQLDKLGLSRNTLVVFTADHGESLGEHGYEGHREEVYAPVAHIPLIMRFPGRVAAGLRLPTPAMTVDVAPTILTLLGIDYPDNAFAGTDLLALDPKAARKRFSLAVKLFTKTPIRSAFFYRRYKCIRFDDPSRNACFDLGADPQESVNLLSSGKGPTDVDWLSEVQAWFERYEDLSVSDFQMTPEQMERLRSLGYIQ